MTNIFRVLLATIFCNFDSPVVWYINDVHVLIDIFPFSEGSTTNGGGWTTEGKLKSKLLIFHGHSNLDNGFLR